MEKTLSSMANPQRAAILCLGVSAALILGAHGFERLGGMAPCLLCLDQREAHWTALGVGAVLLALTQAGAARVVAAGFGALTLVYLFSAGLAAFHAGVEWGFWPGPDGCAAGGAAGLSTGDLLNSLNEPGPEGPPCSEAAWRLFGISMAGYNALISLGLAAVAGATCAVFARRIDRGVVRT